MNDPDNFLSRWSRRKREAGESNEQNKTGEAASASGPDNQKDRPVAASDTASIPEFDPESLPPIETISAETDIAAFMRSGVPETLKHAALRRAWSADPAIRDFVELNENFWDAAGPDGIPGFGDLDPKLDVKRMVSELFGEKTREDAPSEREAESSDVADQNPGNATAAPEAPLPCSESISQGNENAAAQTEPSDPTSGKKFARRHGGAMPH
jgi:hypothetical protein